MDFIDIVTLPRGQDFEAKIKQKISALDPGLLPLQQGLTLSSYVGTAPFKPVILNIREDNSHIVVKSGIFYTGIIAGCSCADDPSPTDEQNEYCEIELTISKDAGDFTLKLID